MPLTPTRILRTFRYGVLFDGVDDYCRLPLSVVRAMGTRFSFDLWMRPKNYINPAKGWERIFGNMYYPVGGFDLVNTANRNDLNFLTSHGTGVNGTFLLQFSKYFGKWMHVVCQYDGEVPIQELWVDAVRVSYKTPTPMVYLDREAGLASGNIPNIHATLHVYNHLLTYDEILQNYNNPEDPISEGLILSLYAHPDYIKDIDGDGILEWIDLSGNNNHAKMYGPKLVEIVKSPARVLAPARIQAPAR